MDFNDFDMDFYMWADAHDTDANPVNTDALELANETANYWFTEYLQKQSDVKNLKEVIERLHGQVATVEETANKWWNKAIENAFLVSSMRTEREALQSENKMLIEENDNLTREWDFLKAENQDMSQGNEQLKKTLVELGEEHKKVSDDLCIVEELYEESEADLCRLSAEYDTLQGEYELLADKYSALAEIVMETKAFFDSPHVHPSLRFIRFFKL